MQISLRSTWRRVLFVTVALACAVAYSFFAVRAFKAHHIATRMTPEALRLAAQLEPGNSEYHHQLGLLSLFVAQDAHTAAPHYRAAVALNPHMAKYWLDLAEAYNTLGDLQSQADAVKHAIDAEPTRPAIAWEAANLYLVQGNTSDALHLLRVVLSNDGQPYTLRALDASWRATHDADLIMREVLPADPAMYATFLQLLIEQDRPDDALKVWKGLTSLAKNFDPKLVFPYVDYEIRGRRVESAAQVWNYLLKMDPDTPNGEPTANLLFNGGFDRDLLNGGFDWRFVPQQHVAIDLDNTEVHDGNRSLVLSFDGEPWSEAGVYHFIPVEPGRTYKFSAFEKAYELLTPSGPRFRITDVYTGATLFESSDLLGSSVWTQISGEFTTAPETRIVKLAIVRNPAFQRISGRFWVDDVSLTKQ